MKKYLSFLVVLAMALSVSGNVASAAGATGPVISNVSIKSNNANPALAKNGDIITLTFTTDEPVTKLGNFKINSSNPDTFTNVGNNYIATHLVDSGDPITGLPATFQINVKNSLGIFSQTIETTNDGSSVKIVAVSTLAAEDFGVVTIDAGALGVVKGYTAGFGLTGATFAGSHVVMQLFNGTTLLQTNTSTAKVATDITGVQISSPFDVSGNFDYAADGFWVNHREAQFGQSVAANRVVATVTLADGQVLTAENNSVTGDPTTIMPKATLSAEDFGVVNFDTGLGILKGYSAGFGLTNATFAGSSVVMKLYNGTTLLQTNTSTAKVGATITGVQISSPFDVSGNFDYVTDGFWVNHREAQFGQSVAANRVVATVTLADGTVLTAENNNLTGDPTTIFAPVLTKVTVTPATATISAKEKDDEKDSDKKDGKKVVVTPPASTKKNGKDGKGDDVKVPNTVQLTATDFDQFGVMFVGATTTFTSSNPAVATVDSATGLVTGVSSGTATITATSVSGTVTVTGTSVITVVNEDNKDKKDDGDKGKDGNKVPPSAVSVTSGKKGKN